MYIVRLCVWVASDNKHKAPVLTPSDDSYPITKLHSVYWYSFDWRYKLPGTLEFGLTPYSWNSALQKGR